MERSDSVLSVGSLGSAADRQAILFPAMDHPSRVTSRSTSVFSLVATLVGGGCLSLPYAFQRTGLGLGLFYLTVSGVLSGYSMRLLLSCSRRTGAQNYEECGEKAFGPRIKFVTMGLLIMMTFLASIAYLILARDLAVPLMESYVIGHSTGKSTQNWIALLFLTPVAPLCFAKSLHSLRFTSLVSLVALCVLSFAVVYRCVDRAHERPIRVKDLKIASGAVDDTLYALPFMELSFMAHFNLLPVHVGLRKPTRRRLDQVVFFTITSAMLFYLLVSFSGYLYAFDHKCKPAFAADGTVAATQCTDGVPGDILNAFDFDDALINVGRAGFLMAILLSFPLLVLPCRDTLLRLLHELGSPSRRKNSTAARAAESSEGASNRYVRFADENADALEGSGLGLGTPDGADAALLRADASSSGDQDALMAAPGRISAISPGDDDLTIIDSPDSPEFRTPHLRRQERHLARAMLEHLDLFSREGLEHVASTSGILVLVVVSMFLIPGVETVWNITGSSVAMILSFVFPAAFYIKIRSPAGFWHPRGKDSRFITAWALFVFSILTTIICTVESFKQLF